MTKFDAKDGGHEPGFNGWVGPKTNSERNLTRILIIGMP
jgi:hypothetical protein